MSVAVVLADGGAVVPATVAALALGSLDGNGELLALGQLNIGDDVELGEELLYDLADLFKVFSDTTRIKILYALMGRELCVADIAEATATSQSAVSHQLRTLKQSHLVKFRRDGRNILYSLADDHVYTMLNQGMSHICE